MAAGETEIPHLTGFPKGMRRSLMEAEGDEVSLRGEDDHGILKWTHGYRPRDLNLEGLLHLRILHYRTGQIPGRGSGQSRRSLGKRQTCEGRLSQALLQLRLPRPQPRHPPGEALRRTWYRSRRIFEFIHTLPRGCPHLPGRTKASGRRDGRAWGVRRFQSPPPPHP